MRLMRLVYVLLLCLLLCLLMPLAIAEQQPVDFTLPDMDGKPHKLSDYRGKWVLVNYWATWCPPCLEELPDLEIFHSQSDGKAVVLGVNMEDIEMDKLREFVEGQFLSFPILLGGVNLPPGQNIGTVPGLPTSYLISPEGVRVARQVGPVTLEVIRNFIEKQEAGK